MFPNQLLSALIRGHRLYLPNIGAQPEPPEVFNVNVQALVYAVDTGALAEVVAEHVNLNQQIDDAEKVALPPPSLDRTFGNDLVAIDANRDGDKFLIVSRGGNQVFRATLDADGKLDILNAAKSRVDCRVQTGNLPSGVAMRQDGTRGYANNEANFSVTSMIIEDGLCLTLQLDISSSEPPAPGTIQHRQLLGKVAFFTALGIPDNNISARNPEHHPCTSEASSRGISRASSPKTPGELRVVPSGRAGRWRHLDSAPGRARRNRWTGR